MRVDVRGGGEGRTTALIEYMKEMMEHDEQVPIYVACVGRRERAMDVLRQARESHPGVFESWQFVHIIELDSPSRPWLGVPMEVRQKMVLVLDDAEHLIFDRVSRIGLSVDTITVAGRVSR